MFRKRPYELTPAQDNGHGEVRYLSIPRGEQAAYFADILARCRARQGVFQKPEWWMDTTPGLQAQWPATVRARQD